MKTKSNLLLFLVITTILLSSSYTVGTAFAASDDDKKNKKTFEQMCAKKKGNEPDALFCRAILGLQQTTDSFFDVFTEIKTTNDAQQASIDSFFDVFTDLRLVDTNLQSQIDSFFDIFVELNDVADKQCDPGQVATGTNLDGSLLCTDITQNQDCDVGYYVSGIDADGNIKCKPLPSGSNSVCGDNTVTAPETCDDGNVINGDGCSAVCSTEGAQCTDGQPIANQISGDCRELVLCQEGQTVSIPDDGDLPSSSSCSVGMCSGGVPSFNYSPYGTACSESGGSSCDGAGSCVAAEVCGDGAVSGTEECDGANLNGLSCVSYGFPSGFLSCSSSCTIDASACVASICGDGAVDGNEQCDFGAGANGCASGCSEISCRSIPFC